MARLDNQSNSSTFYLSILDKCPVAENESATTALQHVLQQAILADKVGYHRYWIAEHHNTTALASPSPELVAAWILGQTRNIRVGSGGVMLQHYSPYKVAENFNLLSSIAPHRVDLGIGKAPGGLPLSTQALQYAIDTEKKGSFETQIHLLNQYLDAHLTEAGNTLKATPIPDVQASRFLLGASKETALFAAELNWHFVFAAHLNGDKALLKEVLSIWQAHSQLPTIVAVQVITAETNEQAKALAESVEIWGVELENGQRVTVASEAQARLFAAQANSPLKTLYQRPNAVIYGTKEQVHDVLRDLSERYGINEFIIDTPIADAKIRLRSIELLAKAHFEAKADIHVA